jgi:hypothetical protein
MASMSNSPHIAASHSALRELGWPVESRGDQLMLIATGGLCAAEMPRALGVRVLDTLRQSQVHGPVAELPRAERQYLFIVESDVVVSQRRAASLGCALWLSSDEVELPPSRLPGGSARWVVEPSARQGCLPTLSTVIWALEGIGRRAHAKLSTNVGRRASVVAGGRIGTGC